MTFIQARRGGSQPSDQAEPERDQGGFIFKGRFVEAIREMLRGLGKMAFVIEQGVGGFGQGVINPLDRG